MNPINAASSQLTLTIPAEHACYADHFPDDPLVPGALLLKWTLALLAEKLNYSVYKIKQVKFLSVVRPGDLLNLTIVVTEKTNSISVEAQLNDLLAFKGHFEISHV